MKIEIEIKEEELQEEAKRIIAGRLFDGYSVDRRIMTEVMKESIRSIFKERQDEIIDRSVKYAGEYIGKKGIKKFLEG